MPLSDATVRRAWRLAQGRCECTREGHGHGERCNRALVWEQRWLRVPGGWDAREWERLGDGPNEAENVEILCTDCYRLLIEAGD